MDQFSRRAFLHSAGAALAAATLGTAGLVAAGGPCVPPETKPIGWMKRAANKPWEAVYSRYYRLPEGKPYAVVSCYEHQAA